MFLSSVWDSPLTSLYSWLIQIGTIVWGEDVKNGLFLSDLLVIRLVVLKSLELTADFLERSISKLRGRCSRENHVAK